MDPPINFDFCFCCSNCRVPERHKHTQHTALCSAATQTDPCCTDDYNTYNCTLNGCEVHVGPGFGTYNQVPYALYECQQDCVSWGCYNQSYTSAYTTTGISYTIETSSTTWTTGTTGYSIDWHTDTGTTFTGNGTDLCFAVFYDTSSMDSAIVTAAYNSITTWRDQEMQPGGLLSAWTGQFLDWPTSHNQPAYSVGGYELSNERWLLWPTYTIDLVETQHGPMPCTAPYPACQCRNIMVICLLDESDPWYHAQNPNMMYNNWGTTPPDPHTGLWYGNRNTFESYFDSWELDGGQLYTLVYSVGGAVSFSNTNKTFSTQVFLSTQGMRLNPALNAPGGVQYDPTTGNATHWTPLGSTTPLEIYGNPGQMNLPPGERTNLGNWVESSSPGFWTNPFMNDWPLEDRNVFGIYDRRGPGVFNLGTLGDDITDFLELNPITGITYAQYSAATFTSNTGTVITYTSHTYTAVTSNTVTTTWTANTCLSAETIVYVDYPYTASTDCDYYNCKYKGWNCGVNGCYPAENGDFFYKSKCESYCRSWSCVTKTGGLQPEGGWPDTPTGAQPPATCEGTIEDLNGVTFSLHQPITGGTYDFVEYCFGIFQPSTIYQINVGLILGGLWDNTGTTWIQGSATTTIVNGLVVNDMGGGNCKTWHPDHPHVPGRITKLSSFRLVDLNGNTIYEYGGGGYGTSFNVQAGDIMLELANGVGYGWSNAFPTPLPPLATTSPDWPNGMPSFVVGPGIPLHRLIGYGNNTTGDNDVKEFTVEVDVFGCPCEQLCYCELIPGQDPTNPTTWATNTPNAWQLCTDECCEKTKTWKCPDLPNHRYLLCNNCPNGGGCYDPLDGSGLHSTQSLCEDDCAVSWNCFSATQISAVTIYSANTTCEYVNYLLPYSGIPVSYFQGKEPIGTLNGHFTTALGNFSGWTWGRWSDINPSNQIIKEAFKFNYGAMQGVNFGGISNAFEAFIYIFDERKGYHDTEFNKIGFWTGNIWDVDISHTCEYPSPQGDKELGVMEGFRNNEFSTMFCIDYELRQNERPWTTTKDPTLGNHPLSYYYNGTAYVMGAAEMCGRDPGIILPHIYGFDHVHSETHAKAPGGYANTPGPQGTQRSEYKNYLFKSVKDLKDKIHWMYSQPDYVDTYGWSNLNLYDEDPTSSHYGTSRNKTNLKSGACTKLGTDLARLYNPGPMMSLCTDWLGNNYTRPHPSNGLKSTTTTPDGLQLKDFWSIGMFRNRHPGSGWHFTPLS